jgi:hypothetical protein
MCDYTKQQAEHGRRVEARQRVNGQPFKRETQFAQPDYWMKHEPNAERYTLVAKPATGLVFGNPNEFSPADDDGRMIRVGDHDPEPVRNWALPSVYFDAVRADTVLGEIISETQRQRDALRNAMAAVRRDLSHVNTLQTIYNAITASTDIRVRMEVNELSDTIDNIEALDTAPYLNPLRIIIGRIRAAFSLSDG